MMQQYQDPFANWFQSPGGDRSLFSDLLEEDPELSYFAGLAQGNLTPVQRRYFEGRFSPIYNQYRGELGTLLQSGRMPSLKFSEYQARNPFTQRYSQIPPELRPSSSSGGNFGRFSTPTKWL